MVVVLFKGGEEVGRCTVESNILRLASPVFRVMLSGNFKEGSGLSNLSLAKGLHHLELRHDSAQAMFTILSILHYASARVPVTMPRQEFVEIAAALEKYDCYKALFRGFWSGCRESTVFFGTVTTCF